MKNDKNRSFNSSNKSSNLKNFINLWNQDHLKLTSLGFKTIDQKMLLVFAKNIS